MQEQRPPDVSGERIVACARQWIGTPYHHQAARKGVGCDCLGLVRGVWLELYHVEAEKPPAYSRDWAEASGTETMLAAARRHLIPIDTDQADAGDVVIFRLRDRFAAKHAAFLSGNSRMIHAMEGSKVSEVALSRWWQRRIAGAFRFPGVSE